MTIKSLFSGYDGAVEGCVEGEDRMASLMNILLKEKRYDDAERTSEDPVYRKQTLERISLGIEFNKLNYPLL